MPVSRIAVAVSLLILTLPLAAPVWAIGDGWGEPTRTCSDTEFLALDGVVVLQCALREEMTCLDVSGCFNLRRMHQKMASCKKAVDALNFACYAGSFVELTADSLALEAQMDFCAERIALPPPEGCGRPCPL
jgi:hypothetical protein